MDDLLEKLRDNTTPQDRLRPLCLRAADEIERLRSSLAEHQTVMGPNTPIIWPDKDA